MTKPIRLLVVCGSMMCASISSAQAQAPLEKCIENFKKNLIYPSFLQIVKEEEAPKEEIEAVMRSIPEALNERLGYLERACHGDENSDMCKEVKVETTGVIVGLKRIHAAFPDPAKEMPIRAWKLRIKVKYQSYTELFCVAGKNASASFWN